MLQLSKFNLKINVISNGLKNHTSLSFNNKLSFIDIFQFLNSPFDSFVKSFKRNDFKYLSQGFDNNVLDLAKQKGFYTYDYTINFGKFKEQLPSKEKLYSLSTGRK